MTIFSWNRWNIDHIDRHGVGPSEAEYVVTHARSPFPRKIDDAKWLVWGQTPTGRYLQVIFIHPPDDEIDIDSLTLAGLIAYSGGEARVTYVIHAMDMDESQKGQLRKTQRIK